MSFRRHFALLFCVFAALSLHAGTHYVDLNSTNPVSPFATWATAATNIQDAIDAATNGDTVLVTNGVYQTGGRLTSDGTTNRVAVTKAVTLQSVNGSGVTVVNGGNVMRCIYLTNGAALTGFTLTNGSAGNGGGVYCFSTNALISSCLIISNSASSGGGAYSGTLTNCTISGNRCPVTGGAGGGAAGSLLNNCTLSGNATGMGYPNTTGSTVGGAAYSCTLNGCTISGNAAYGAGASGGGAYNSTLYNCTLSTGHADQFGGGSYNSTLVNCRVMNNSAGYGGGGVSGGNLTNCVLSGNSAGFGGGIYWTTSLYNCTVYGNYAGYGGGGYSCTLHNCIIYYNSGGDNYGDAIDYCCTPDPGGTGNITNAPLFADGAFHLQAGSPCINAGNNAYATILTDLDGNLRIANGTVDIGAYEYQQPNPATVSILCDYVTIVTGITASFKGVFSRGTTDSWNFGDGTVVSNQIFVTHAWTTPGDYTVKLTIFDSNNPSGASGTYLIHVIAPPVSYVNLGSTNPVPPYSSWQTAATNIQDAVDAVVYGAHILVTNGTYQAGGRIAFGALTNRVAVNKPVLVQSVNGPTLTTIQGNPVIGDGAIRCVYLTNGAALSGFTLLNGGTRAAGDVTKEQSGGGVWCASSNSLVTNCLLVSNAAYVYGGGSYGGTLSNCSLISNAATGSGGGAYLSTMNNCVLSNNTAIIGYGPISGGGASSCTLVDCTLVSNVTDTPNFHPASGGGAVSSTLIRCTLTGNSGKDGGGANSCVLSNCSLLNNTAGNSGGAAAASTLVGCTMISNSAAMGGGCYGGAGTNCVISLNSSVYQGGGATGSFLYNCLVTSNFASGSVGGGGAGDPSGNPTTFVNCTVYGNVAYYAGGGAASCTAWNSIIVSNSVINSPDTWNWSGVNMNYCCTTPLPGAGTGNIVDAPLFVNQAAGNFQLQSNSPGINAGSNSNALTSTDLAGNPRIIAGTVDMGAYECQAPALLAYFSWMQGIGLPTTTAAMSADSDGDGASNFNEWRAGTNPTNANSVLRVNKPSRSGTNLVVTWQGVTNVTYFLQRATNLNLQPAFAPLATNIAGQSGTTSYTDTNVSGPGPFYYRVGVQ